MKKQKQPHNLNDNQKQVSKFVLCLIMFSIVQIKEILLTVTKSEILVFLGGIQMVYISELFVRKA